MSSQTFRAFFLKVTGVVPSVIGAAVVFWFGIVIPEVRHARPGDAPPNFHPPPDEAFWLVCGNLLIWFGGSRFIEGVWGAEGSDNKKFVRRNKRLWIFFVSAIFLGTLAFNQSPLPGPSPRAKTRVLLILKKA